MIMSFNNKVIKSKRDYSLDALQGLLISYMIMVHAFQWANIKNDTFNEYASYIMFFFMPWFFYKSGMFHHSTSDLRTTLNKLARKLLIPYLVFSLLGEFVASLHSKLLTIINSIVIYFLRSY